LEQAILELDPVAQPAYGEAAVTTLWKGDFSKATEQQGSITAV